MSRLFPRIVEQIGISGTLPTNDDLMAYRLDVDLVVGHERQQPRRVLVGAVLLAPRRAERLCPTNALIHFYILIK